MAKKKAKPSGNTICQNKKARHDYHIDSKFEAGIELKGWEVKCLREGRAQLVDSYVILHQGEAWLIGAHFNPLATASTHVIPEPARQRRLLLHKKEIARILLATQAKGFTCVALSLYWKDNNKVKCEIALAKGKKQHDKRDTEKDRDWNRQKQRVMSKDKG